MIPSPAQIKFDRARAKGELQKYFGGYPEYALQHPVADMPTDEGAAITPVQQIAASDPTIRDEVQAAWLKLAEDPVYGWFVIHYFTYAPYLVKASGQEWLPQALLDQIAERLRANKDAYMKLKRWHGETLPDGCWELLWAENRRLHRDKNITVLPEEL
jgi:hypothetical protein